MAYTQNCYCYAGFSYSTLSSHIYFKRTVSSPLLFIIEMCNNACRRVRSFRCLSTFIIIQIHVYTQSLLPPVSIRACFGIAVANRSSFVTVFCLAFCLQCSSRLSSMWSLGHCTCIIDSRCWTFSLILRLCATPPLFSYGCSFPWIAYAHVLCRSRHICFHLLLHIVLIGSYTYSLCICLYFPSRNETLYLLSTLCVRKEDRVPYAGLVSEQPFPPAFLAILAAAHYMDDCCQRLSEN